jgi:long-subunit acyl-CoA synthetase (AMP-forming)
VDNLKEVRPTEFVCVPRVFEKIAEKMIEAESKQSWAKLTLLNWAKSKATEHNNNLIAYGHEHPSGLGYKIAHKLILGYIISDSQYILNN